VGKQAQLPEITDAFSASSKDTTDFWTSHPITQGISSDFSQRFCATHSSAHAFTRKSTTTSTATQTEDSPNVGETQ
jgi:hypothetical protein